MSRRHPPDSLPPARPVRSPCGLVAVLTFSDQRALALVRRLPGGRKYVRAARLGTMTESQRVRLHLLAQTVRA